MIRHRIISIIRIERRKFSTNFCFRNSFSKFKNLGIGDVSVNLCRRLSQDSKNSNSNLPPPSTSLGAIYSIPNVITMARICASPLISLAIVYDHKEIAFFGCIIAGISDWLDGYLARTFNLKTTLGGILDPLADKIFIGSIAVGLCAKGLIPLPLVGLIIGRDVLILSGALYLRSREKTTNEDFFDLSKSSTFVITPSVLSKVNTGVQFALLISTLGNYMVGFPSLELLSPLWYVTAATTTLSGIGYLDGKGIRRFVKRNNSEK